MSDKFISPYLVYTQAENLIVEGCKVGARNLTHLQFVPFAV